MLYCQTNSGRTFSALIPATKIPGLPATLPLNIPASMPDCIYAYTWCYARHSASIQASKANDLPANMPLYTIASMHASFIACMY